MSMDWYYLKHRISDGTEFCKTEEEKEAVRNANTRIQVCECEYCGKEILKVSDKYSHKWWGYLGNQAAKPNIYKYSPIIQAMRKFYNVEGQVWKDCPIHNLHSRCHTKPNDWSKRAHPNALKELCNECFARTKTRVKVMSDDGILCDITVLPEKGETIESVMKELNINGKVLSGN